ncbi:MAG: hypothetical protein MZV65_37425 [Chromatiales bacterium]|nr:hypothetical protein [Chromatiales bacterium]
MSRSRSSARPRARRAGRTAATGSTTSTRTYRPVCVATFGLKDGVKTLDGAAIGGDSEFSFSTGGPAIRQSRPFEGGFVDEEQVFLLGLDAPAEPASIAANAYCEVQGIKERVPVRLADPDTRRQLLAANRSFLDRYVRAWTGLDPQRRGPRAHHPGPDRRLRTSRSSSTANRRTRRSWP